MKWLCKLGLHNWQLRVGMNHGFGVCEQFYTCSACRGGRRIKAIAGKIISDVREPA